MEYTINQMSDMVGLTTYTLRYYEKVGLLVNVKRDKNGRRYYDSSDIEWIEFIKCLRDTGMSINDIKYLVELIKDGEDTINERKKILRVHKDKLAEQMRVLQASMNKINRKIEWYDGNSKLCNCKKFNSVN